MIGQQRGDMRYYQFDHYLQFPAITHGIFTRLGGVTPDWGLNVSFGAGDSLDNVHQNRLLALQALQVEQYPCATLWLVHGADVAVLDTDDNWEWRFDRPHQTYHIGQQVRASMSKPRWKADAIITRKPGVTLAITAADCVPLLFYDPVQHAIGVAHAGWRGTARGIAFATMEAMHEQFGSRPRDIYAGLGPSIGPCCYEVTEHVRDLFLGRADFAEMPTAARYRNLVCESAVFSIQPSSNGTAGDPSLRLDLWETNRNQLLIAGIPAEQIELSGICTACNTDLFYSHRGEHGHTGRFPAFLALHETDSERDTVS